MKILLLPIITATLLATLHAAPAPCGVHLDKDSAIQASRQLAEEGNFKEALEELLPPLLDADPATRAELYLERASLLAASGNHRQALEEADYAVSIAPQTSCAKASRAIIYEDLGEPGLARIDADDARRNACSSPELTALLGRLYILYGDPSNAITTYATILNDPDYSSEANDATGFAYFLLGNPNKAVEHYSKVLSQDDQSTQHHTVIADALSIIGRLDEAVIHYERAIQLDPKNHVAVNNRAYNLFLSGHTDRALELLKDANTKNPSPYSLCSESEIYFSLGNPEDATRLGSLCLNAFSKEPRLLESEKYYINAMMNLLRTSFEDRLALHPRTQFDLATQARDRGKRAEALSGFISSMILDPMNPDVYLEIGQLYLQLGDLPKGFSFLNTAISKSASDSAIITQAHALITRETTAQTSTTWYKPE